MRARQITAGKRIIVDDERYYVVHTRHTDDDKVTILATQSSQPGRAVHLVLSPDDSVAVPRGRPLQS